MDENSLLARIRSPSTLVGALSDWRGRRSIDLSAELKLSRWIVLAALDGMECYSPIKTGWLDRSIDEASVALVYNPWTAGAVVDVVANLLNDTHTESSLPAVSSFGLCTLDRLLSAHGSDDERASMAEKLLTAADNGILRSDTMMSLTPFRQRSLNSQWAAMSRRLIRTQPVSV